MTEPIVWVLTLLTACGPPNETADVPTPRDPSARGEVCAAGMSAVSDDRGVAYCIDTWEATIVGELGDRDQHKAGRSPTLATAVSAAGQVPTVAISFDQARAACANTPVLDARGREVGRKRLPTSQEWEDAADGRIGDGGRIYAFGDTWAVEPCRVPGHPGPLSPGRVEPTGSLASCRSPTGTYDQTGNGWEWADPGMRIDIDGWFSLATSQRTSPTRLDSGQIALTGLRDTRRLKIELAGLRHNQVTLTAEGVVSLEPSQVDTRARGVGWTGYLALGPDQPLPTGVAPGTNYLPVTLDPLPGQGTAAPRVVVLDAADGALVPDKRGCSGYAGNEYSCRNAAANLNHFHDFVGTIGFRCAADPLD